MGFEIYDISAGKTGVVAICALPGRDGAYAQDLAQILAWQPDLILSLTEPQEMGAAAGLIADLKRAGVSAHSLPIQDFGVPSADFAMQWPVISTQARAILDKDGKVLAHCLGGQGRSGMVITRLLVERGENPGAALTRLRAQRPAAVETSAQFDWITQGMTI
ncbi:MAG: protein-tyrosine phosphatase family protein [Paracoccaceae bacterium]